MARSYKILLNYQSSLAAGYIDEDGVFKLTMDKDLPVHFNIIKDPFEYGFYYLVRIGNFDKNR
jgi:hypothetical protein